MRINETVAHKSFQFQLRDCAVISGDLRAGRGRGERNISEATEACSLYSQGADNSVTRQHKSSATNQGTELQSVYSKELEAGVAQLV